MGFWKKTPDFTLEEMRVIRLYSHTVADTEEERLRQINVALQGVSEGTQESVERHKQEMERLRREVERLENDRNYFDGFDMTAGAVRVLPLTITRDKRKWKIKRK